MPSSPSAAPPGLRLEHAGRTICRPPRRALRSRSGFLSFGPVLRTALLAPFDAHRVEGPAYDVIAHTRQVLHTTAANQDDRVLLKVVPHAGDIGRHLDAIGQPHSGHLTQGRVRLLRRRREDADADAPP